MSWLSGIVSRMNVKAPKNEKSPTQLRTPARSNRGLSDCEQHRPRRGSNHFIKKNESWHFALLYQEQFFPGRFLM